jgi:hypothetical protein
MFADLDESIRQLLMHQGNLNSGEVDIAFDMPPREWAAGISKPTINLYLFDIRENTELKNPGAWTVRPGPNNTAIKGKPDIRVDLNYNITAFANNIEDEHRLLSRALLALLQNPVLPEDVLQGQVQGQEIPTYVAQPRGLIQSPGDYWGALDNDLKPSIDYRVVVRMNLNQEITTGLVLTSNIRVGPMVDGIGMGEMEGSSHHVGGTIHRKSEPESGIPDVGVTLLERALDTVTDAKGRYQFSGVPAGIYTLVIAAPDQAEERQQITVPTDSDDRYDAGI